MTIKAYMYASFEERSFDATKCLAFVTADSWWDPAALEGPDLAKQLYGKQLAVDFLDWADATGETERFVDIIDAMPPQKGLVERAFLEFIAEKAPAGAR